MGYATWRTWIVTKLNTIDGLNVYGFPTDKVNFPAAIVKVGENAPNEDQETNRTIHRDYDINIDLVVSTNPELKTAEEAEDLFATMLDSIVELFDAVENRHPNDNQASRQRLVRAVPRDSVNPDAKRIATVTLRFYKRNG